MYTKWSKLLVVANAIVYGAASALQSPLLSYKDFNVDGSTNNNPHTAACTPNYLIAAWNKQLKSHIFDPTPNGEGMHATTAVIDAVEQRIAHDLRLISRDYETSLLDLEFEDDNGRTWLKTVWSDDQNYPGGGFPVYPHAETEVEKMCKFAMQAVNCADGSFTIIVDTGYKDHQQAPINICVQLVLDKGRHPNFPGRSCYPKGIHRYNLPAGTVNPAQCLPHDDDSLVQ